MTHNDRVSDELLQVNDSPELRALRECDCIGDVDVMLLNPAEYSVVDVAHFVVREMHEMAGYDMPVVESACEQHRRDLRKGVVEPGDPSLCSASVMRKISPAQVAQINYRRSNGGIDARIELESSYLVMRERLGWIMDKEREADAHNPDLVKEFMAIKDVLKEYAKLAGQDPSEGNGVSVSVNVGGGATRRVIEDPESRHKVLLLVSKMRELGAVDVIDADGVESVEHDGSR